MSVENIDLQSYLESLSRSLEGLTELTLDDLSKTLGIIGSTVTTFAIIVGGIWAYRKYVHSREGVWNLKMSIEHNILPYSSTIQLLVLYIVLENIGKIAIRAGDKGCPVTIRSFTRNSFDGVRVLRWEEGVDVLISEDVIGNRPSAREVQYEIEPGCTYRHMLPVTMPIGLLLMVRATFWWEDNKETTNTRCIIDLGQQV